MKLTDIRFSAKNKDSGYDLFQDTYLRSLRSFMLENTISAKVIIPFFDRNKDNSEPVTVELRRIDLRIEELCLSNNLESKEILKLRQLRDKLSAIYSFSKDKFKNFRAKFTEYLGAFYLIQRSKKTDTIHCNKGIYFHEPYIHLKRQRQLSESVVDIVHINRKVRKVNFCECKANVNNYLRKLSGRDDDRAVLTAKNKVRYMINVKKFFKYINQCQCEVAFLTLSSTINNRNRLDSEIEIITGIDVINLLSE